MGQMGASPRHVRFISRVFYSTLSPLSMGQIYAHAGLHVRFLSHVSCNTFVPAQHGPELRPA